MMNDKEKAKIETALEEVWPGQCWTIKKEAKEPGWPDALIVIQGRSFLYGNVLTLVTQPLKKLGFSFPIRVDLLVDHYTMEYDHVAHLGLRDSQLSASILTLEAIRDLDTTSTDKLKTMAALHLKTYIYE